MYSEPKTTTPPGLPRAAAEQPRLRACKRSANGAAKFRSAHSPRLWHVRVDRAPPAHGLEPGFTRRRLRPRVRGQRGYGDRIHIARSRSILPRGHAAEPPSTAFVGPSLRSGPFGMTASRRRGVLHPCPFVERCGRRPHRSTKGRGRQQPSPRGAVKAREALNAAARRGRMLRIRLGLTASTAMACADLAKRPRRHREGASATTRSRRSGCDNP